MKILVVDDEKTLVKGIKFNLENEGYQVDVCYDGAAAIDMVSRESYALVLLDVMMPELDGIGACMQIREFSTVPIIMLTAKGEDADKLMGFECGADDYITKPFNIMELKARIRALIRRAGIQNAAEKPDSRLIAGNIVIDPERRAAENDGRPVELTAREFDLIELLMRNPGKVYSRESLLDLVWGFDYQGDIRTVDVHVRRLREKLERVPAEPVHLVTKWGVGYFFAEK